MKMASDCLPKNSGAANKPLVVRLDGNNVEEGRRILTEANHPLVTLAATMDEGADKAAVETEVLAREKVVRALAGAAIKKVIVVPDRLVNLVV